MTVTIARQMIGAELLKLRRNRALLAFALLLGVATIALYFGFAAVEHASNPARYGPAGGAPHFERSVRIGGLFFGALAAILIGAEAGTADISSGVFRDLVATGRSRLALFAVRAPGAILLTLAVNGLGFVVGLACSFLLAGSLPTPGVGILLESAGWIALSSAVIGMLAVGVGSASGSRAVTLTAVIGLETVATQLLVQATALGQARDALPNVALGQLNPFSSPYDNLTLSAALAVLVLLGWILVSAAIGAWRTAVRDA